MASRQAGRLAPIHAGEVLHSVLEDAGLTANALALRVLANRIGGILKGERGITADTALQLARYFGTSAKMWMNDQAKCDLTVTGDGMGKQIAREVLPIWA